MRIIAGEAGGRRLIAPATSDTRPATDRVREAVFSSIAGHVEGAAVADLYAGTGAFGLEALSRGASSAIFVENGRKALEALSKNIGTLDLGGSVVNGTVRRFLDTTALRFDLVFIDPPWPMSTELLSADLAALDAALNPGGFVVASRRHTDEVPTPPESWRVAADKRYGDTRILRYQKGN
jgi:16S rRNA (guanine966-N2)-methyltransferase